VLSNGRVVEIRSAHTFASRFTQLGTLWQGDSSCRVYTVVCRVQAEDNPSEGANPNRPTLYYLPKDQRSEREGSHVSRNLLTTR